MKELFKKQLEYENWANSALFEKVKESSPLPEKALFLFSHLLSASNIWLSWLAKEPIAVTLFQVRTLEECLETLENNRKGWDEYFNGVSERELEASIEFVSPLYGIKRRIEVSDAIMHIAHHSSYHRGQIVMLLKGTVVQLPLVTYMPFASLLIE